MNDDDLTALGARIDRTNELLQRMLAEVAKTPSTHAIFVDAGYLYAAAGRLVAGTEDRRAFDVDAEGLKALVGEFANELLSCAWRHKITEENRSTIESVAMQAIAGAMGPPSLDDLAAFDFTEEPFEDPLGIALSWEEKYKKKDEAPAPAPAAEVKSA